MIIDPHTINPARAQALAEECQRSKGYDAEGLVNENAAGDDKFCRWVMVAFPKGEWSKLKAYLVDTEKYSADLLADLLYYRGVIKAINEHDTENP